MKTLDQAAFDQTRQFIKTQARPVERALFEYHFENAGADEVIAALAAYQNADGGFGHALEPDMRSPSSSALATGIALGRLKEVNTSALHPMVRRAVRYLQDTFDAEARVWRVVPADVNEYPHAPWWHDEGGSLARTFNDFVAVPTAQLVGLLHHYADLVPEAWLEALTEHTVAALETAPDSVLSGGGDGLHYALDLAETRALPQRYKDRLVPRLRSAASNAIECDPDAWSEYSAAPLKVISSPQSVIADLFNEAIQRHLDYLITHQTAEGCWKPNWTWGGFYPEDWETARHEWCGVLTLENLLVLDAFGRLNR